MRNILILTIVAGILTGCFQKSHSEQGPEDILRTFYKSLCAGEFAQAESMCDTLTMKSYIDGIRSAWNGSEENVIRIASDILSEMSVDITEVEKNGQSRTIFYNLTIDDSLNRRKVSILKKEEGAWKIEQITDRN